MPLTVKYILICLLLYHSISFVFSILNIHSYFCYLLLYTHIILSVYYLFIFIYLFIYLFISIYLFIYSDMFPIYVPYCFALLIRCV